MFNSSIILNKVDNMKYNKLLEIWMMIIIILLVCITILVIFKFTVSGANYYLTDNETLTENKHVTGKLYIYNYWFDLNGYNLIVDNYIYADNNINGRGLIFNSQGSGYLTVYQFYEFHGIINLTNYDLNMTNRRGMSTGPKMKIYMNGSINNHGLITSTSNYWKISLYQKIDDYIFLYMDLNKGNNIGIGDVVFRGNNTCYNPLRFDNSSPIILDKNFCDNELIHIQLLDYFVFEYYVFDENYLYGIRWLLWNQTDIVFSYYENLTGTHSYYTFLCNISFIDLDYQNYYLSVSVWDCHNNPNRLSKEKIKDTKLCTDNNEKVGYFDKDKTKKINTQNITFNNFVQDTIYYYLNFGQKIGVVNEYENYQYKSTYYINDKNNFVTFNIYAKTIKLVNPKIGHFVIDNNYFYDMSDFDGEIKISKLMKNKDYEFYIITCFHKKWDNQKGEFEKIIDPLSGAINENNINYTLKLYGEGCNIQINSDKNIYNMSFHEMYDLLVIEDIRIFCDIEVYNNSYQWVNYNLSIETSALGFPIWQELYKYDSIYNGTRLIINISELTYYFVNHYVRIWVGVQICDSFGNISEINKICVNTIQFNLKDKSDISNSEIWYNDIIGFQTQFIIISVIGLIFFSMLVFFKKK